MSLCFCFVHNYIQLPWSGQSKSKFVQVFFFDDVHKSLFKASTSSKNTELNTLGVVLKMTQNQKKKKKKKWTCKSLPAHWKNKQIMMSRLCKFSSFTGLFPGLLNLLFLFFFLFFSTSRWWAEGGAGCEGHAVAQSAQHEALCRSEPLHPNPGQREGGARIPGTQRKRGSVGELHQSEQNFIWRWLHVMWRCGSLHTKLSLRLIKSK